MPAAKLKLYLPYGNFHRDSSGLTEARRLHAQQVTYHWFYIDRETPLAPYESLILGYRGLSAEARTRAEHMVDEFLSEEEYRLLRDYLRTRHRDDLRTTVLSAPVQAIKPDTSTRAGTLRPFRDCADDPASGSGFCKLSEEEGYSLPFRIWGYYAPAVARPYQPDAAE